MDILEMLSKVERLLKTRTPKMTKAEFYKACDITASAVSQWRNGKTQPARSTIDKMAEVLGVTAYYLTDENAQIDAAKQKLLLMVEESPSLPSGERLRFLFDTADYDPMVISYNLDIDQTYIDNWMENGNLPPQPIIDKVLGVFHMKVSELLNDEELSAYMAENEEWGKAPRNSGGKIKKMPTPVSESGRRVNVVTIAGRDGKYREKCLTDEAVQVALAYMSASPAIQSSVRKLLDLDYSEIKLAARGNRVEKLGGVPDQDEIEKAISETPSET